MSQPDIAEVAIQAKAIWITTELALLVMTAETIASSR
jgi:hypothetical protein